MQIENSQLLFLINHVQEYSFKTCGSHKTSIPGHRNLFGNSYNVIFFFIVFFSIVLYSYEFCIYCTSTVLEIINCFPFRVGLHGT